MLCNRLKYFKLFMFFTSAEGRNRGNLVWNAALSETGLKEVCSQIKCLDNEKPWDSGMALKHQWLRDVVQGAVSRSRCLTSPSAGRSRTLSACKITAKMPRARPTVYPHLSGPETEMIMFCCCCYRIFVVDGKHFDAVSFNWNEELIFKCSWWIAIEL